MFSLALTRFREFCFGVARALRYVRGHATLYYGIIGLTILSTVFEAATVAMAVPMLQSVGDRSLFGDVPLLGHIDAYFLQFSISRRLQIVATVMLVAYLAKGGIAYLLNVLQVIMSQRIARQLQRRTFRMLAAAELGFIEAHDIGEINNFLTGYAGRVVSAVMSVNRMVLEGLLLCLYTTTMLIISWKVTLLAMLFFGIISMIARSITSGPILRISREVTAASQKMGQVMYESVHCPRLVRLSVGEEFLKARHLDAMEASISADRRLTYYSALIGPLFGSAAGVLLCVLLFGTATLGDVSGPESLSQILVFLYVLGKLVGPISGVNSSWVQVLAQKDAFERLDEYSEEVTRQTQPSGEQIIDGIHVGLTFDAVAFQYPTKDEAALKDVSFDIKKGELVALVGPSGAGKSTIAALISRLYEPSAGAILVDDVDLRELHTYHWRRHIGVVSQDIVLLNDSVAGNICYPRTDVPFDRVHQSARLAHATEFIERLPQGYEAPLGESGLRLSGGQRQRIAIARAILDDPDILIFDEATSQLDSASENAIQASIEDLRNDRIVLVIAHRLSTIRKADKILVIDDGVVVEQGTHSSLVQQGGVYRNMLEMQMLDLVDKDLQDNLK